MGLIRLIILGIVIWLCLRMVRKFQATQQKRASQARKKNTLEQSAMVPCRFCNVHIPESKAIRHEQSWFCSEEHKNKYLNSDSNR